MWLEQIKSEVARLDDVLRRRGMFYEDEAASHEAYSNVLQWYHADRAAGIYPRKHRATNVPVVAPEETEPAPLEDAPVVIPEPLRPAKINFARKEL